MEGTITRSGRHELRFEEGGIVLIRVVGDLRVSEMEEMFPALRDFGESQERQYWLFEMRDAGTMTTESRRFAAQRMPSLRVGAAAMIHAGFEQRMIAQMLTHVYRLFGKMDYPVAYFDDEAAARAWLKRHGA